LTASGVIIEDEQRRTVSGGMDVVEVNGLEVGYERVGDGPRGGADAWLRG
jgi:hypothetical protein